MTTLQPLVQHGRILYSYSTPLKYHSIVAAHAVNLPFHFVSARLLDHRTIPLNIDILGLEIRRL